MAFNRKFVLILAVMMPGMVLLTGCGEGEETGLDEGPGITDPSGVPGEDGNVQDDNPGEETDPDGNGEGFSPGKNCLRRSGDTTTSATSARWMCIFAGLGQSSHPWPMNT